MVMPRDIRAALAAMTPLDRGRVHAGTTPCKVCGGRTLGFDLVDANKCCSATNGFEFGLSGVGVLYLRCEVCDFVFTADFDDWTEADFATHIYNHDYDTVDPDYRQARAARLVTRFIRLLDGHRQMRVLDYGSGAGVFVGGMRAAGFANVAGYDPFSNPARPAGMFDVITCVEVLEHSPDPVRTLRDIAALLAPAGVVQLQTGIQPPHIQSLRGRWWYIAPRNGHISIFSQHAMMRAARRAGLHLRLGTTGELLLHHAGASPDPALLRALGNGAAHDYAFVTLTAPGQDAPPQDTPSQHAPAPDAPRCVTADAWQGIERFRDGSAFRWTRADTIAWELAAAAPVRLDIVLDVRMAVTSDFVDGVRLAVNGGQVPLGHQAGRLAASTVVHGGTGPVRLTLRTPAPVSPAALGRNTDTRTLGLAVPVG